MAASLLGLGVGELSASGEQKSVDDGAVASAESTLDVSAAARAKMTLCTDGKSHYVAVGSYQEVQDAVYYGDGKRLTLGPIEEARVLRGQRHFFDPRFYDIARETRRGLWNDALYSRVIIDDAAQSCALVCGSRTVPLRVVAADEAHEIAAKATFLSSPHKYQAYGLARDDRGTYYYVDRGASPKTAGAFRVFVGPRGHLKQLNLANVASDSQGAVFSSADGRLLLRWPAQLTADFITWIEGSTSKVLTRVPLAKTNMLVVYNDLGVYAGERLGTPCDDL